MDYLYSLGNILILLSLSFRKIIYIRVIFVLSDIAFLTYGALTHIPPIAYWAVASLLINLVQIVLLVRDMMPQELSDELEEIKTLFFDGMQTSDFLRLIKLSRRMKAQNQKVLIQDEPVENLMLITKGKVYIDLENTILELNNYHFIGEMSYFGGGRASNTIYTREPVEFICWSYADLRRLEIKNPALFMKMIEAMGKDLMLKMIKHNNSKAKSSDAFSKS